MASRQLKRWTFGTLVLLGIGLWVASLLLLSHVGENSAQFGRLQNWILLVNLAGGLVLLTLIAGSLYRLIRDYRRHVAGARLKARMVTMFVVLAVLPLGLVHYFAVQFINRGIDSWFNVDVEQGLSDALRLGRLSLDMRMREHHEQVEAVADELAGMRAGELISALSAFRRETGASEVTVFGYNSRIVATSAADPMTAVPNPLNDEVLLQIRQDRPYVSLEPKADGGYHVRIAVALRVPRPGDEQRVMQAFFPVAERLSRLADNVQSSYTRYSELAFLRGPLKATFTLTLTLIVLVSLLAAVYGAFFWSRRLVAPIQRLVAGTRAVARGRFDTRLPVASRDDLGFLVNSFNEMTRQLSRAREEAERSERRLESERADLAVILARLSTGVVALESDLSIRIANQAASSILGVDLERYTGHSIVEAAGEHALLQQFVDLSRSHLESGETEWREQIVLRGEVGRRVLMCACTALPGKDAESSGYVVVFDDITALLQAQRDAAWGEVARRLAHEIKNPLTPIQLSAERLRRKYLPQMEPAEAQLLDRATHTIVQQVEAMKEMVNAFSDYARAPDMEISRFPLNPLVSEIVDLYRVQDAHLALELRLDPDMPPIEADAGRVRQILHNLMRNAVEALEGQTDGRIDVCTRLAAVHGQSVAEIVVEDNGPGFQTDKVSQVFEPYVTSKPKGTGLGLAIVKKLVEEHGGRIEAGNRAEGGARLAILLPVNEAAREAMLPHAAWRKEQKKEWA
jgi:nitrogen fixation/metabolism regulation signal transduction histidine kinase